MGVYIKFERKYIREGISVALLFNPLVDGF